MKRYLLSRFLWIPVTLLGILLLNFSLLSVLVTKDKSPLLLEEDHYLSFSSSFSKKLENHYGLMFPFFFNTWDKESSLQVQEQIQRDFLKYEKKIPFQHQQIKELYQKNPKDPLIEKAYALSNVKKEYSWKVYSKYTLTRLGVYFNRLFHLKWGPSDYYPHQDVFQVISAHSQVSLKFVFLALLLVFWGALILGGLLAYAQDNFLGKLFQVVLVVSYALPIYLIAPFLIDHILVPLQSQTSHAFFKVAKGALAIFCLTYSVLALYTRLCHSLFLSAKNQMHVLVAKACGASSYRIWKGHILKPVLAFFIPLFCNSIQSFFMGLIVVENLLDIHGFGYLFYQALLQKDLAVILGCIVVASTFTLFSHLLADFFTFVLDPRVRHHDYPAYRAYS